MNADLVIETHGLINRYGAPGSRRPHPARPPGRGLRLSEPQRRRQDNHHAHVARADPTERGPGTRPRPATRRPGTLRRIGALVEYPTFYPLPDELLSGACA